MKKNAINILLVEDNDGDILLILEAFEGSKTHYTILVKSDGEQAISYLQNLNGGADRPDLVLLDIYLPKKSGFEVLSYLKNHPTLKSIPVIMLSTSDAKKDTANAYLNYANCYITKPQEMSNFSETVKRIENFWLKTATFPPVQFRIER